MFTSFKNDSVRIAKQMEISSFPGRYSLETPGPGLDLPFCEDAQIRIQHFGANRCKQMTNIESNLFGLNRKLSRDSIETNNYAAYAPTLESIRLYRIEEPYVLESRASHPAWLYRDLEQSRWERPWLNPQANLEKPFMSDIQTRILEKDYYSETNK